MALVLRRKKHAIRMMATVVLFFAACWAPFHLVSLLLDYGNIKHFVLSLPYYYTKTSLFFCSLQGLDHKQLCENTFYSNFSGSAIITESYDIVFSVLQ